MLTISNPHANKEFIHLYNAMRALSDDHIPFPFFTTEELNSLDGDSWAISRFRKHPAESALGFYGRFTGANHSKYTPAMIWFIVSGQAMNHRALTKYWKWFGRYKRWAASPAFNPRWEPYALDRQANLLPALLEAKDRLVLWEEW